MRKRLFQTQAQGQNLVELALVLPFLVIIIFAIVEIGRVWQTYQGAKIAAIDGAYTASVYQNESLGEAQMQARLNEARIPIQSFDVVPVQSQGSGVIIGYKAEVRALYQPLFGGMQLPTLADPIEIIPDEFPIDYNEIYYSSVY